MTAGLRCTLAVTDALMLGYWLASALVLAGLLQLPPELLYKDYADPMMTAWNWSFMPLDIAFSLTGIAAVRRAGSGGAWRGLAIVSLTLTMCAGGLAIGFWAINGDFDWGWWLPNLALLLWPLVWLPGLVRSIAA